MSELQRPFLLELILSSVSKFGPTPLLRIPREDALGSQWDVVTYGEFGSLLHRAAAYWHTLLSESGLKTGDVVLLRITGEKYTDLAHTLGICLAGYTPHVVSPTLPENVKFLYDFMALSKAKALLCDPSYESMYISPPVPLHRLPALDDIPSPRSAQDFHMPLTSDSAIAAIFHTTGTSSGMPKLVPQTYKSLQDIMRCIGKALFLGSESFSDQSVITSVGSWAHFGGFGEFLCAICRGDCIIKPTRVDFLPSELVAMARNAKLNRVFVYGTFLKHHLHAAHNDTEVLAVLQGLRQVSYVGVILQKEEQMWAYDHQIPIANCHGNTECGPILISSIERDQDALLLRPIDKYIWAPFGKETSDVEIGAQAQRHGVQYLELVIPASNLRCPDPSLRGGDPTADYHTGDLFEEVKPGLFEFRGRSDDLIKMRNAMVCNTREIEAHVYATCSDLVSSCIVVGYGRITPALIVEAKDASVDTESTASKVSIGQEIIRRIAEFTQQMLVHERITNPALVRVVSPGTLPRAGVKQSISRKTVERLFAKEIDEMYAESVA